MLRPPRSVVTGLTLTALLLATVRSVPAAPIQARPNSASPGLPSYTETLGKAERSRLALIAVITPDRGPGWPASRPAVPESDLPPLVAGRTGGYTVASIAAHFHKTAQRFGGLVALGPAEMTLYTPPRPNTRPDLSSDLRRFDATRRLLSTFTRPQWQTIAARGGIGASELNPEQRALWEQIVPNPLVWTRIVPNQKREDRTEIRLSDVERENVRLRIKLVTTAEAKQTKDDRWFPVVYDKNKRESGREYPDLVGDDQYGPRANDFGVNLVTRVPNRPKPGDLDFAFPSLNAPVSLLPENGKPLTLKILTDRIAQACRLEVRADRRLHSLPVITQGQEARAGDVLKALAFGVCGAIRRLGPDEQGRSFYLLTRDVQPVAAQQAQIDDWYINARQAAGQSRQQENKRIAQANPVPLLSFDADEPLPLPAPLLQRVIDAQREKGGNLGKVEIRIEELSVAQRQPLVEAANRLDKLTNDPEAREAGYDFRVRVDRLRVSCGPSLGMIVPGAGEITTDSIESIAEWLPPAESAPPFFPLKGKALYLQAATLSEATDAVAEAKKRGAAALWLNGSPDALRAAVQAGKAADIPIVAVVPLLAQLGSGAAPDRNVLGETSAEYAKRRFGRADAPEWQMPDHPQTRAAALRRVRETAAVPGLSALVLRDVLPPGYRSRAQAQRLSSSDTPPFRIGAAGQMGYSLAYRLAFLQEKGIDPADIVPNQLSFRGEGDIFDDGRLFSTSDALAAEWVGWRNEHVSGLLKEARTAVQQASPSLPLLLQGEMVWRGVWPGLIGTSWFVSWPESLQTPPDLFRNSNSEQAPDAALLQTRAEGTKLWLAVLGSDGVFASEDLERQISPGWDGFVVDLAHLPWPEAKARLAALAGEDKTGSKSSP